jgi:hypothetical protein
MLSRTIIFLAIDDQKIIKKTLWMDLSDGFTKKHIVDLKSVAYLLFAFLLAYCLTSTVVI